MFTYKLPIGDWSDDGHGKCEWYLVRSNKSARLIEAAFSLRAKLALAISGFEHIKANSLWGVEATCDKALELLKKE